MRTLRRLALGLAAALALAPALAGAARAGDVIYPQLGTATTVQDTDLIATWRASGPLTKVQASVLEAYLQGKLSPLFLQPANNLSDLANVGTARTNLGLGSAALANIGTSGTALCQLNANCTWAGTEAFNAKVTIGASAAGGAMFNLTPGAAPTTPVAGDLWDTSSSLFVYLNGATHLLAFLDSSITGNAGSATKLATARTITVSGGDVACSGQTFDGTANITIGSCALAGSGVGAGTYGDAGHVAQVTVDAKGRVTGASSVAINYPSQLPSMSSSTTGASLSNNGSSPIWRNVATAYFQGYSGSIGFLTATNATVSRIATGCYQISFTNPMPNTGYTFIGTAGTYSGTNQNVFVAENDGEWSRGTGSIGFCVVNTQGNPTEGNTSVNILVMAN